MDECQPLELSNYPLLTIVGKFSPRVDLAVFSGLSYRTALTPWTTVLV